jgi:hypothetical protein
LHESPPVIRGCIVKSKRAVGSQGIGMGTLLKALKAAGGDVPDLVARWIDGDPRATAQLQRWHPIYRSKPSIRRIGLSP